MKIAVPYENGEVFQHFGHAERFCLYTVQDGAIVGAEALEAAGRGHDAVAELLQANGVDLAIVGGIGIGAENALREAGISFCSGVSGSADEAVQAFLDGTLKYSDFATCDHHHEEEDEDGGCGGCGGCGGGCGGCGGGCGSCGDNYVETRTFTEITHLTYDNFEQEVLADPGLICIDFWATWCGPCKAFAPVFEQVNAEQPKVKFCKVNVDDNPEIAQLFGIESIPTCVLVQNRRTLSGFVGLHNKEDLTRMIEGYLR